MPKPSVWAKKTFNLLVKSNKFVECGGLKVEVCGKYSSVAVLFALVAGHFVFGVSEIKHLITRTRHRQLVDQIAGSDALKKPLCL